MTPGSLHVAGNGDLSSFDIDMLHDHRVFSARPKFLKGQQPFLICPHHPTRRVREPNFLQGVPLFNSIAGKPHRQTVSSKELNGEQGFLLISWSECIEHGDCHVDGLDHRRVVWSGHVRGPRCG